MQARPHPWPGAVSDDGKLAEWIGIYIIYIFSGRYSKDNNKYIVAHFEPIKPTIYIVYLDANKLYGKAKSYPQSKSGFTWLSEEQWQPIDWLAQKEEQSTGYFVDCDLEYKPELHDSDNDYPLAPEWVALTSSVLSDKQIEVARHFSRGVPVKHGKHLPSFLNKSHSTSPWNSPSSRNEAHEDAWVKSNKHAGFNHISLRITSSVHPPRVRWRSSSTNSWITPSNGRHVRNLVQSVNL